MHMLCICEDNAIYKLCHDDLKKENGQQLRAERMANFARRKFGLTAELPDIDKSTVELHPCTLHLSEANEDTDEHMLMRHCQEHKCSGHCMRKSAHEKE